MSPLTGVGDTEMVRARKTRETILRKYWRNAWVWSANGDLVILSLRTRQPIKVFKEEDYL